jgi:cellulose synthase/poly-beta-1,6-N-acetylglucosamine synthase-like glycosyltransferase
MIEGLFWASAAVILYTYFGYPLLIWLASLLRSKPVAKAEFLARVSVVIACHNEAQNVAKKLSNLLDSDYPSDLLEVIVVSDGSTDSTAEVARQFGSPAVKVFRYSPRQGKAAALNLGVARASGEVIVFADARQQFDPAAIRALVSNFADPVVGVVSGELILQEANCGAVGPGLYWRYETLIRKSEGRAGSVMGATGAIYAIRRALWKPLPIGAILDDVYTPMQIAMSGYRVVFEERARAFDSVADSTHKEFRRKARTLAGNYQLCQLMPRLLVPGSWLVLQFWSHKLFRLAAPIFMLLLFASNSVLVFDGRGGAAGLLFSLSLAIQFLCLAGLAVAICLRRTNHRIRLLNLAYTFSLMNLAAIVGLIYFLTGKRNIWERAG